MTKKELINYTVWLYNETVPCHLSHEDAESLLDEYLNKLKGEAPEIVISATFSPGSNNWYGIAIDMSNSGTHVGYNVIYNGSCVNEYFLSEKEAKDAALSKVLNK